MTILQALVMAVLQGVTELFPISSLGHAVILPALLHWKIDEKAEGFLPFLAVMHLGTAIALLGYFWKDWLAFALAVVKFRDPAGAAERRLFWRVVVATLPAVIIGFALEKTLRRGFGAPMLAAGFLIVNGVMLFAAERLKRAVTRPLSELGWGGAVAIGFWQCLALIPGMSRSGATMAGGNLTGSRLMRAGASTRSRSIACWPAARLWRFWRWCKAGHPHRRRRLRELRPAQAGTAR